LKVRLDRLLLDRNIASTIKAARAVIGAGEVYVKDRVADKSGSLFDANVTIRMKKKCPFVSRGGLKLEKGITHFNISPENLTCIDIGASSGGFTDCLLQHNVKKVFAVDVAYGQLAWKIRQDSKVTVLERFNARNISLKDTNNTFIDLAVIDVSFISLTKLLPQITTLFHGEVSILALIKPQFELIKSDIGPKGVVKDSSLHEKAIHKIEKFAETLGLISEKPIASPLLGPQGNREFLIHIHSR